MVEHTTTLTDAALANLSISFFDRNFDCGRCESYPCDDSGVRRKTDKICQDFLFDEKTREKMMDLLGKQVRRNVAPVEEIDVNDFMLDKEIRPALVAEYIKQQTFFITPRDTEEIYIYDEGIYKPGGEVYIKESTHRLLGNVVTTNHRNEVVNAIQCSTYVDREEINNGHDQITLSNGLLNINTKEFSPHNPENISSFKHPVEYDPKADCPKIKEFISQVVAEDDIPLIQEMIGYTLLKDYPIHKAFMLLGSGRNGKSVLLNIMIAMLGIDNVATPSLYQITKNNFALAALYGKSANIHADLSAATLKYTGNFKMLCGGDPIHAEKKHKDPFTFYNFAKMIYSANELPASKDLTPAFFERWMVINFPNYFPEGGSNTKINLIKELTTDEELSGLLNWAIEGLQRLLENSTFTTSKSRADIERDWIAQTDSFKLFIDEETKFNPESEIPKEHFYNMYNAFCIENDITNIAASEVGKKMPVYLQGVRKSHPNINGKQTWCWKGVEVKGYNEPIIVREEPEEEMHIQKILDAPEDDE